MRNELHTEQFSVPEHRGLHSDIYHDRPSGADSTYQAEQYTDTRHVDNLHGISGEHPAVYSVLRVYRQVSDHNQLRIRIIRLHVVSQSRVQLSQKQKQA
jgi:hypothetical protein